MVCGYSWIFFAAGSKPTSIRRALAERLAEDEQAVIIDRPVSVLRDRKIPALKERCGLIGECEAWWYYRPLHYPERFPAVGRFFKVLNVRRLKWELDQLVSHNMKRVVCFDSPNHDHLVGQLGEDISIYLAIDDRTVTVWGDPIPGEMDAEKRLLAKVDKVICVSEPLADILRSRIQGRRNLPIHVVPNAYDERFFDPNRKYMEPPELKEIPKPRILVAGHVSKRIDWEGIAAASQLRPRWVWIFLGPVDEGMEEKIEFSFGRHGFYYPPISVQDVPAWIHHCDVCAVPYRLNSFTRASHPLKALEYLAMGAPVLSTRIPSLERYDRAIVWVNQGDGESYARALDKIANQVGSQEIEELRRRAVSGDSWRVRVNQFREIVFNAIS